MRLSLGKLIPVAKNIGWVKSVKMKGSIDSDLLNRLHRIHKRQRFSQVLTCAIEYYVKTIDAPSESSRKRSKEMNSFENEGTVLIQSTIDVELFNQLCQIHEGEYISDVLTRVIEHYVEAMEGNGMGQFMHSVEKPTFEVQTDVDTVEIDYDLSEQLYKDALTCAIKHYIEAIERGKITEMNQYIDDGTKSVVEVRDNIDSELMYQLYAMGKGEHSICHVLNCAIKCYVERSKV